MKLATNTVDGAVVDLGRRADLVDVAGVHDRDAVAHRQRFLLVVGHVDERDPDLALDALELELHRMTQFEVERAERFVEQQRARIVHQRAGQCDTLLLAAGQLGGPALGEVGQTDDLQQFVDPLADLGLVLLAAPWAVRDVVPHRHVREQRVVLEHRVDVALVRRHPRDVDPLEADGALGRVSKPAIIRSVVVFPQPDGPSSEKNSPEAMEKSASVTAT